MRSRINRLLANLFLVIMICMGACQGEVKEEEPQLHFRNIEEARAFVKDNLNKPIPEDYQIPAYISSGLPLSQVYDSLEARFPNFYGLDGETYLQAIVADPEGYVRLNLESKSIRRYYDPESKY